MIQQAGGNIHCGLRSVRIHSIDQAFIVSPADLLLVRLTESRNREVNSPRTLDEVERLHILGVLDETRWRIKGDEGTAALLGMNSSGVYSKMKKRGIPTKRENYVNPLHRKLHFDGNIASLMNTLPFIKPPCTRHFSGIRSAQFSQC